MISLEKYLKNKCFDKEIFLVNQWRILLVYMPAHLSPSPLPPRSLAMKVLPYLLILLLILPQNQGCKNLKARIIRRPEYGLTAQNVFETPEVKQIVVQIIKNKFGITVKKEDLLKILSKMERKYDQKIM